MRVIGILLLLPFFFTGCSQKDTANDTVLPVITITQPVNGQIFTAGQSIPISGTISDNNYIAEAHLHVTNSNTGSLLVDIHLYPAAANTSFSHTLTAVAGVNYKIQVIAKTGM